MKVIKIVLISIVAIAAILLIVAVFIPREIFVEQTIVIDKPSQQVYDYIRFVKNHDNFSVWASMDPEMKKEYRGIDGTVGFVFSWQSDKQSNVGTGEQEIQKLVDGKSVAFELRFIKPHPSVATATMTTEAAGENQTKVSWNLRTNMKYPMNIMKPVIEGALSKNLQTGLQKLKEVLESK